MSASVAVTLDTTTPRLRITANPRVEPPQAWVATVTSDEEIGDATAALVDAQGSLGRLGVERVDAHTMRVLVPTPEVSGGPASVSLRVADTVGNATVVFIPVDVLRPASYVLALGLDGAYDLDPNLTAAYEVSMEVT